MNEALRKIAALIFLYSALRREAKRVNGMIRLNEQDVELSERGRENKI